MRELRRHQREFLNARIKLSWHDGNGIDRFAIGRCVDVSEAGLQVDAPDPVPAHCRVSFRIEAPAFHGTGSVRYCRRRGLSHRIGVEFVGGLSWSSSEKRPQALKP